MTPKEKAIQLFNKCLSTTQDRKIAKKCVLIGIFEMIDELTCINQLYEDDLKSYVEYWGEVKEEVEKL